MNLKGLLKKCLSLLLGVCFLFSFNIKEHVKKERHKSINILEFPQVSVNPCAIDSTINTVFNADFENTSGDNNWTFSSATGTDGQWEIGVPNPYVQSGTTTMEIAAFAGGQDLLTGNGASQDLDGGPTNAQSPTFVLPTGTSNLTISFQYYFSHFTNGNANDYFRVELRNAGSNATLTTLVNEIGAASSRSAIWTAVSESLLPFAGQSVYLYATAADPTDIGGKVEAAIDAVQVYYTTYTTPTINPAEIVGTVWEDWNYNGDFDENNPQGVAGIEVTVYDKLNTSIASVLTDSDGNYTFSGLITNDTYRVEFVLPASVLAWASPTFKGAASGTRVQFVQPGNCANLGIASPADYCEDLNPPIIVSCFETGNAVYGGTGNANKSVVDLPYNSSGPTVTGINEVAKIYETGSVWGLAWQPHTKRLFGATSLKRHTGLGSLGLGGVYVMEYSDGAGGSFINSFDLAGVTPANGGAAIDLGTVLRTGSADYTLPDNNSSDSHDIDAFSKAGKVGFGDTDLASDGETLWLTNLHQRALVTVDVSNPAVYPGTVNQYPLDGFANVPTCTNGVLRPWGIGFDKNKGYVGCVCTGEDNGTIANTQAYVLSFDPSNPTSFTTEVNFDLDYSRELAVRFTTANSDGEWQPWVDTWSETGFPDSQTGEVAYPQPLVSDIAFAENGDMIIAMSDRFGFQTGYNNYVPVSGQTNQFSGDVAGDLLKACYINGSFILEGGAGCGDNDTNSTELDDGPNGTGEFFFRDDFDDPRFSPTYNHNETSLGSIGILKGTNEITATHYDPINGNYSFDLGLLWHDNTTGDRTDEFRIVGTGPVAGKGNNLGDVIIACTAAPLQIGNLVWLDNNRDGIQDASEKGLEGIRIELYSSTGTLLAFDTTDIKGEYYFSGKNIDNATWLTSDDTLATQTSYYIVVGNGQFATNTSILTLDGLDYELTTDSTDSGTNRFIRDSDGVIAAMSPANAFNDFPVTFIQTGDIGQIDHTFDFGFKIVKYDYGDLADAGSGISGTADYETLAANNGPSHRIIDGLNLGVLNDADVDGNPSLTAIGDDTADGIDDEDGVSFPSSLNLSPGGILRLPFSAINTTGDTAYVKAWIDWDADGELTDGFVFDIKDNEDGIFPAFLEIMIPENVSINNNLGFRIRLSNTNNLTPYGQANSGEVEDYVLNINCPSEVCLPIAVKVQREE